MTREQLDKAKEATRLYRLTPEYKAWYEHHKTLDHRRESKRASSARWRLRNLNKVLSDARKYYRKKKLRLGIKDRTVFKSQEERHEATLRALRKYHASDHGKQKCAEWRNRPDVRERQRLLANKRNAAPERRQIRRAKHAKFRHSQRGREWYREKQRCRNAKKKGCLAENRLILSWERKWRKRKKVTCYWCRIKHPPDQCHMDHVVALRNGGSHTIGNVCISCRLCNVRKNAKTLEQWNNHLAQPALL